MKFASSTRLPQIKLEAFGTQELHVQDHLCKNQQVIPECMEFQSRIELGIDAVSVRGKRMPPSAATTEAFRALEPLPRRFGARILFLVIDENTSARRKRV